MPQISSGLLMYRRGAKGLEVLLVHPGGPIWKNKDIGAWSIPKGQANEGEDLLATAQREFNEELGFPAAGLFVELGWVKQKAGKIVHAWAFAGDCDPAACRSNTMQMQWPPRSGKWIEIPEVDRAEFFNLETARQKLNPAQVEFLDRLMALIE